jgi:hypothetical protein
MPKGYALFSKCKICGVAVNGRSKHLLLCLSCRYTCPMCKGPKKRGALCLTCSMKERGWKVRIRPKRKLKHKCKRCNGVVGNTNITGICLGCRLTCVSCGEKRTSCGGKGFCEKCGRKSTSNILLSKWRKHEYSHNHWTFSKKLGYKVRSRWERYYLLALKRAGIRHSYEPKRFTLPDGNTYLPDIFLNDTNIYVEIKGWDQPKSKEKRILFRRMGYRLILIKDKSNISANRLIKLGTLL